MNRKSHVILDHPVIGYFVLFVFAEIVSNTGMYIDVLLSRFIPGYAMELALNGVTGTNVAGVGVALCSIAAVLIFTFWFRPEFKGVLQAEGFKEGLLMMLPFLVFHYFGSAVGWFSAGISGVMIPFLRAFAPGFSEEVAFRGLGVANYMRTAKSEKDIMTIFWLSSVFFGLVHLTNIFAGGDPFGVVIQSIYCIGVGMVFGAVYLRTGNLWVIMVAHMTLDFVELMRADLAGGVMTGIAVADWITTASAVFGAVLALRMMSKEHLPQIMELWNKKWSKE